MLRKKWLPDDQIQKAIITLIFKGEKELDLCLATCDIAKSGRSKIKKAIIETEGRDLHKIISGEMTLSDAYNQYLNNKKMQKQDIDDKEFIINSIENLIKTFGQTNDDHFSRMGKSSIYFRGCFSMIILFFQIGLFDIKYLYAVYIRLKDKNERIVVDLPEELKLFLKDEIVSVLSETILHNPESVKLNSL